MTLVMWDDDHAVELHPGIQPASHDAIEGAQRLAAVLGMLVSELHTLTAEPIAQPELPDAGSAGEKAARHVPRRPAWTCAVCTADWPCPAARDELTIQHSRSRQAVATLLGGYFMNAVSDLPDVPVEVLHPRFLGWIRRAGGESGGLVRA